MRRTIAALIAAMTLVAMLTSSALALPPKHVGRPSLTTTACTNLDGSMTLRSDWANEAIADPNVSVTFTWTFTGKGLPSSSTDSPYVGPTVDPSFVTYTANTFIGGTGPVAWNSWSGIATAATGAFSDTAKTIRQPSGGWPTC